MSERPNSTVTIPGTDGGPEVEIPVPDDSEGENKAVAAAFEDGHLRVLAAAPSPMSERNRSP